MFRHTGVTLAPDTGGPPLSTACLIPPEPRNIFKVKMHPEPDGTRLVSAPLRAGRSTPAVGRRGLSAAAPASGMKPARRKGVLFGRY